MEIFQIEFMQRAFLGGIIVGIACAVMGVFVTLRKEAFISEAIAHASLTGVAMAYLLSVEPLLPAIAVGVVTAVSITYFQLKTKTSSDSIIGMFFSLIFAIGIILLNFVRGYRPELTSYLFGSILGISTLDIIIGFVILVVVSICIVVFYEKLLFVSLDPEGAKVRGVRGEMYNYLIRILAALVIIISIKTVGIILVTALFVIPASGARLFASRFKAMIPLAIIFSSFSIVIGLISSYYIDIPSGATIVVVSAILYGLSLGLKKLFLK